ncbi:MAG TPA: radical SAM protein [Ruminococcaceae bacterium]|nr:radical SAM protein [Oscillospiraceae bacterium]
MSHANIALFVPHMGCPQQCSFCNQRIISGTVTPPNASAVERACEQAKKGIHGGDTVQLAFFGGSFTAIDRNYMIQLLTAAKPYVDSGFLNGGIRVSTRPDCIDREILDLLRSYGVSAIELGAQSMDDRVLMLNHRGHTAQDVRNASQLISSCGFELGLQMMTGLYGSTDCDSLETAKELIALCPQTVRIYPTVVLRGTQLDEWYRSGEYVPQTVEQAVNLCSELLQQFEENGIRVIRLGLHAQEDVERQMVAGAYHPALRELCQGEIYYRKAFEFLKNMPQGQYQIAVAPTELSKAVGQKKINLSRLAQQGYACRVQGDDRLQAPYELRIRGL